MRFVGVGELPAKVTVRVEVPRGSFVKRGPTGAFDFLSPLPCPYDYGSVLGTRAPDGDPLDALVLGTSSASGTLHTVAVRAVMGFVDAGAPDPKLVCSSAPLTREQCRGIERFFATYAWLKRAIHLARRERGPTYRVGWLHPIGDDLGTYPGR